MWKVAPPDISATDAFDACTRNIQDPNRKQRLGAALPAVAHAADLYTIAARQGNAAAIRAESIDLPRETAKDMIWAYERRMATKGASGRHIYDALLFAARNKLCPLCGHRDASTLDHYLPKTTHPALAVNPYNLVPACTDCNWLKRNLLATVPAEATLHPYFDDIDDVTWLVADVHASSPAFFTFTIRPGRAWASLTVARVNRHFTIFRLAHLYAIQAANELTNIRYGLKLISDATGAPGVQQHLGLQADSRSLAQRNSWQTAAYVAMASSGWFCGGGFNIG